MSDASDPTDAALTELGWPDTASVVSMSTADLKRRLHIVSDRLHTERRMDGDTMRQAAQMLYAIEDAIFMPDGGAP